MSELILKLARRYDVDAIVQLGDFGFYNDPDGLRYIEKTESKLAQSGKKLYFIDGNHENYDYLLSFPIGADGLRQISEHLFHLPRAHRWEWDGVSFLALGGAHSIDREYQLANWGWWPEEKITQEQADAAKAGGKVDVMFTHDCPWGVDIDSIKMTFWEANDHRKLLREVVNCVMPEYLFHGHYHQVVRGDLDKPYEIDGKLHWHRTQVFGLHTNGLNGAWKLVDFQAPISDTVVPRGPILNRGV